MPIPAVQGHALVARVALELLLGVDVPERLGVEEFVFLDVQLADRQRVAVAVAPVRRGQAGFEDLFHLVIVGVAAAIFVIIVPTRRPRPDRTVRRRCTPPSPIRGTSAAPGRPCSPPGARPRAGLAPWRDRSPLSASQVSPSSVYWWSSVIASLSGRVVLRPFAEQRGDPLDVLRLARRGDGSSSISRASGCRRGRGDSPSGAGGPRARNRRRMRRSGCGTGCPRRR